jgi:hypothetical protein
MQPNYTSRADAPSRDHNADLTVAFNYIRQLSQQKYFGTIVLSMQSGNLITVRRDEVLKPSDLTPAPVATSRGTSDARSSQ